MTGAKSPFARIAEVTEEETFQVLTFLECAVKFDYANIIIPLPRGGGGRVIRVIYNLSKNILK